MAEQTPVLPNPVLSGMADIQSAVEASQLQQPPPQAAPEPLVDADSLEKARQADRTSREQKVESRKERAPEPKAKAQDAPPEENPDPLAWKPKDTRKSQQWEELRAKAKEADTLRAEIEQLKKGVQPAAQVQQQPPATQAAPELPEATKAELETLRKERSELLDVLKQTAIERDPEFNAKFNTKRDAALKQVKFAAGGASEKLTKILELPAGELRDQLFQDAVKDFGDAGKSRLMAAMTVLNQVEAERSVELDTRKATFEMQRVQQLNQQATEQTQRRAKMDQAFQQTLQAWQDPENGMPFFVADPSDPKAAAEVSQSVELAKNIFAGKLTEPQLAQAALWAAAGPRAVAGWQQAQAEVEKLTAALGRLRGATPGDSSLAAGITAGASNRGPAAPTSIVESHPDFHAALTAARRADGLTQ